MTPEEFAARLNGRQYGEEITKEEEAIAREHGLVVCFGYSDDSLEIKGAVEEELSACNGAEARIVNGHVWDDEDFDTAKFTLKKLGISFPPIRTIKAEWDPEGLDASWLITSEGAIAFDIYEDENLFCRGCVFKLDSPTEEVKNAN